MSNVFTKLAILADLLRDTLQQWRDEVWRKDLDAQYCCDGRECGCFGATLRDIYRPTKTR